MDGSKKVIAVAATALAIGGSALPAQGQDSAIYSLSGSSSGSFGSVADTEIVEFDAASQLTRPWLMAAASAFYAGDVDGDGASDEWTDVDALWVAEEPDRVSEVWVSFETSFGPFLDGDIVRLTAAGGLEIVHSEAALLAAFGMSGGMDLDALHVGPDGRIYSSFADDEASTLLSTDAPGVVTDGSIVWWDPASQAVGVELREADVDALVSNALGSAVATIDTFGVAMDRNGVISFCVQSPSSDDATVFSSANSGEIVVAESSLGLSGSIEMDALQLTPAPAGFLAARATPRVVPAGQFSTIDLDGPAPNSRAILLLALARGDADAFPFDGFRGLALDPTDPLFLISLGLPWTYVVTDASGHASLDLPVAPPGIALTLIAQPYDLDQHAFGTPIAVEIEG